MNESITGTSRPRSSHIGRRLGIIACIVALMTCWIGSASAETGTFHQKNDPWSNLAIPDNGGWANRAILTINVSGIPANAKITSVKYTCWVNHTFRGDLCVDLTAFINNQWISHKISDRSGGSADNVIQTETFTVFNGGCYDASANPTPSAKIKAVNTFNPNGSWSLVAWDNAAGDSGALDGLEIWINWETPVSEMDVKGNGVPIADGDSTPSTGDGTDFGQTPQGTSVERTFWVYNTGGAALTPGTITVPNGYTLTVGLVSSIAPGGSDYFKVRLNATSPGTFAGDISIPNNDPNENPYNFRVTGTVFIPPEMDVKGNGVSIADGDSTPSTSDYTDFGDTDPGIPVERTFWVYNTGGTALTPGTITVPSGYTLTVGLISSIAPAGSDYFKVRLNATSPGTTYEGDISIPNNDPNENPYNFRVKGSVRNIAYQIIVASAGASSVPITGIPSSDSGTTPYDTCFVNQGANLDLTAPQYVGSGLTRKSFSRWELTDGTFISDRHLVRAVPAGVPSPRTVTARYFDDPEVETIPPRCNITSHTDGQTVSTATIRVSGTASDGAGCGDSGISAVYVNGVRATNDTATGGNTANWYRDITLNAGPNPITVYARDGASPNNNQTTTDQITVTYGGSPGTLQFAPATYTVGEAGGTVTLTVTRTGGSSGAVGVSFATSNGTAMAGSDYTTALGTLSWASGDTASKTLTVSITDDSIAESPEAFTVTLSNPTGGATLGSPSTATVNITDDPPGQTIATHSSAGYQAGGACTVSCSFAYPAGRQLLSLAWRPTLPTGWTLQSVSGSGTPEIQGGDIVFVGALASNPVQFSYVCAVPAGQTGVKNISAVAEYTLDGMANPGSVSATPNPLSVSGFPYHRADYRDTRWVIDGTEVNRVLAYWRAGSYHVDSTGLDSYASGAGSHDGVYHSADYRDTRWVIDGTEVNRVLAYWRAGGYHVDPAGLDGYASGAGSAVAKAVKAARPGLVAGLASGATHQTVDGATRYTAGTTLTLTGTFSYTGTLQSLLWRPHLPAGWTIGSATGSGTVETVSGEILWTGALPPSPVSVSYTVNVPAGATGTQQIRDEVEYMLDGQANPTSEFAAPDPLSLGDGSQSITFPALPVKTYGDADFAPGATASSGLAVTYTSSNAAVATIAGGNVHIVGAGTAMLTASQSGNGSWNAATPMAKTLTVAKKALTATADNKTRSVGQANPAFTIAYTGLVTGDTAAVLDTPPTALCSATATSAAGTYPITVSGGSDANYAFSYVAGTLTITPVDTVTVSVSATPASGGTVSGGGTKNSGSSFTVTATAGPGKVFSAWTEGDTAVSSRASYSFTATANRVLVANFTDAPPAPVYTVSTAFAGTVTVAANWVDFSVLDADDTNCNDWVAFPVTYNAYLVLCYGEILCPVCPFPITDAWLWLVDKKGKQLFAASLEDGGITDAQGYCFGNGNVGVTFATFLPYADLEGLTGFDYTTSPAVTFALSGTRAKASSKTAVNILQLTGGTTLFTVSPAENANHLTALECEDGSELAFVTASFKKSGARVKPDPYCPECATNCDSVYAAQLAAVAKAAKKYFWWDILGEGDVQPVVK